MPKQPHWEGAETAPEMVPFWTHRFGPIFWAESAGKGPGAQTIIRAPCVGMKKGKVLDLYCAFSIYAQRRIRMISSPTVDRKHMKAPLACMLVLILPTLKGWKAEWTLAGKKVAQSSAPDEAEDGTWDHRVGRQRSYHCANVQDGYFRLLQGPRIYFLYERIHSRRRNSHKNIMSNSLTATKTMHAPGYPYLTNSHAFVLTPSL